MHIDEEKLREMFDQQSEALITAMGTLHQEALAFATKTKSEILDTVSTRVSDAEVRILKGAASQERLVTLESRVNKLEAEVLSQ